MTNPVEYAQKLEDHIGSVFVGNQKAVHTLVLGFLSDLHVLIEDIPGVGKTTLARSLAKSAGLDFGRIQFTPDLLPGDILGMTVWSAEKREFVFREGAIMHQFILADEINRASARTQSSLLEAMQEGSVTVDGTTYPLPQPFFVLATQNPVTFAGTFHLPEAQTDRFGLSLSVGYPTSENETTILDRFKEENPLDELDSIGGSSEVVEIRQQVRKLHVDAKIKAFLVEIANRSRHSTKIKLGMSPRATQHLLLASQAEALLKGRDYILPEDVLSVVSSVLAHRIVLSAEARMENLTPVQVIERIVSSVSIPAGI
jgi:MoxR-like ATPase